MTETTVAIVKLSIGLVAAAAWLSGNSPTGARSRWLSRSTGAALAACAVLATCAYFQFGRMPAHFVHRWEMFHYYVGAKYHSELGYERLYRCTAVADAQDGLRPAARRAIRDLKTDGLERWSDVVAQPQLCTAHFTPQRWSEFKSDVRFFRRGLGQQHWELAQLDHGYNPPPLWTATWGKLIQAVPASLPNLQWLASLDLLFMAASVAALGLSFGWRTAALTVVFWGSQAASDFGWTGGGLVRQDWLFLCVAALALLHRHQFGWAGAALALAGLLRLFPLLLFVGPCVVWLASWRARGTPPAALKRFVLGAALASSVAVGVSVAHGTLADYREFWSHIQLRREAIVSNHMGLRTLLSATSLEDGAPHASAHEPGWVSQRRGRLQELRVVYVPLVATLSMLVALALWRTQRAWVGAALATALIPILLDPSNYYYSFFILLTPLVAQKRSLGVLLCVVATGGQLLSLRFDAAETRFVALSWLYVGVSVVVTFAFARGADLGLTKRDGWLCKTIA